MGTAAPPATPPRPVRNNASWSRTAYSSGQAWLISQLTLISGDRSLIRHMGTRRVGDGCPTAEMEAVWPGQQQVILVRLCAGYRLNSPMYSKLKLASSPICPCDQEDQAKEHVLQRCPLRKATREDVWPVSTSLMTRLYGCKQELEKTTSFIF